MKLFPELMISIIEEVATRDSPLAYMYPDPALRTLLNLVLVSHSVFSLTMPFIYARIRIDSKIRLGYLHRTLCSKSSTPRRVESFAVIIPFSYYGYLTREEVEQISDLLDIMSSSLQRLLLDLAANQEFYALLREAMFRLPHIVEFVNIRHDIFQRNYSILRSWKSLRRLALFHPPIMRFGNMPSELPILHHLVLVRCFDLDEMIRRYPSLRIIALIDPRRQDLRRAIPILKERNDIRFDLHLPDHKGDPFSREVDLSWYRIQAEMGTLWLGRGGTCGKRPRGELWEDSWEGTWGNKLWGESWEEALLEFLDPAYTMARRNVLTY